MTVVKTEAAFQRLDLSRLVQNPFLVTRGISSNNTFSSSFQPNNMFTVHKSL